MELNVEGARYITSHLYIKYKWTREAITAFFKYFFCTATHTSKEKKSAPTFLAEMETLQPHMLKLSRFSSSHPTRNIPSLNKLFLVICLVNALCFCLHADSSERTKGSLPYDKRRTQSEQCPTRVLVIIELTTIAYGKCDKKTKPKQQ